MAFACLFLNHILRLEEAEATSGSELGPLFLSTPYWTATTKWPQSEKKNIAPVWFPLTLKKEAVQCYSNGLPRGIINHYDSKVFFFFSILKSLTLENSYHTSNLQVDTMSKESFIFIAVQSSLVLKIVERYSGVTRFTSCVQLK